MKGLPYFRWFPADAETDAAYSAMSWAERGFYHWCLNYSWINDGLPADLDELARCARITRKELDRLWLRVGSRFQCESGCLRNKRQEDERAHAVMKSERASSAVRTRYGRRTDVPTDVLPRAQARADSDSDSLLSSNSSLPENREISVLALVPTDFDRWWKVWWNHAAKSEARKAFAAAGIPADELIQRTTEDRARWQPTSDWNWRSKIHPATWLRGRRWEDDLPPEVVPKRSPSAADRALALMEERLVRGERPL